MNLSFSNTELFPEPTFQVIVNARIGGETFTIGKVKFNSTEDWKETREKLTSDDLHPSDEFLEVLKDKFKYYTFITDEELEEAYIEFIFVDNCQIINL